MKDRYTPQQVAEILPLSVDSVKNYFAATHRAMRQDSFLEVFGPDRVKHIDESQLSKWINVFDWDRIRKTYTPALKPFVAPVNLPAVLAYPRANLFTRDDLDTDFGAELGRFCGCHSKPELWHTLSDAKPSIYDDRIALFFDYYKLPRSPKGFAQKNRRQDVVQWIERLRSTPKPQAKAKPVEQLALPSTYCPKKLAAMLAALYSEVTGKDLTITLEAMK